MCSYSMEQIFEDRISCIFMTIVKRRLHVLQSSLTSMISRYSEILKLMFELLNKEKNPRVIDNICAAVCRMIMASQTACPVEVVGFVLC